MRVLHLIDAGRPRLREFTRAMPGEGFDDRVLACGLVCRETAPDFEHRVCIVGTARAEARARRLGVVPDAHISPTLGSLRHATGAVGALITSVRPDLVHWWGPGWTGGCFGRPGRAWTIETLMGATPLGLPVWLCGGAAVVCGSEEGRWAAQAGLGRIVEAISPAFPATDRAVKDATPRKDGEPLTVLLLGPGADARPLGILCGLIGVVGTPLRPTIERGAFQIARARRLQRLIPGFAPIKIDGRPRSELLNEADLAVWMGGDGSPVVSIASALASGVPVVAPPSAAPLFCDEIRGACMSLNANPPEVARKLLAFFEQPDLRGRTIRAARASVDAARRNRAFVDTIAAAWRGKQSQLAASA